MTYATLQTDILTWLARTGDADAVTACPVWIRLAESELRMALSRLMVTPAETVNDAFSISAEYTDLPTGFIRARGIKLNGSPDTPLEYIAPNAVDRYYFESYEKPKFYTIQGNKLRVIPAPDTTYTAVFTYYSLPSLSVSVTTNWLLDNYEAIYFCAVLAMAYKYYGNEVKKNENLADLDRMLTELEITQAQGAQAGALQAHIDSGTP